MLALDDARDLLGLGSMAEQAERDMRLESLGTRRVVECFVELRELALTVGRDGIEIGRPRRRRQVMAAP
jgi:hypothetical protein